MMLYLQMKLTPKLSKKQVHLGESSHDRAKVTIADQHIQTALPVWRSIAALKVSRH